MIVSLLLKGLMGFGAKLLATMASEKMIEWAFFKIADSVASSTQTTHDDAWVAQVKELYFQPKAVS